MSVRICKAVLSRHSEPANDARADNSALNNACDAELPEMEILMRLRSRFAIAICGLAASTLVARAGWFRDETPPANAKPLSEIIKSVEDRHYGAITEVEFEGGKWEIEVHQPGGKEIEIHVDAISGQITRE